MSVVVTDLEYEDEGDPLVEAGVGSTLAGEVVVVVEEVAGLGVDLALPGLPLHHQLGVHQAAHQALVLRPHVECGVDPAVVVQHLALHPRAGLAVDGVSEVLLGYT